MTTTLAAGVLSVRDLSDPTTATQTVQHLPTTTNLPVLLLVDRTAIQGLLSHKLLCTCTLTEA